MPPFSSLLHSRAVSLRSPPPQTVGMVQQDWTTGVKEQTHNSFISTALALKNSVYVEDTVELLYLLQFCSDNNRPEMTKKEMYVSDRPYFHFLC